MGIIDTSAMYQAGFGSKTKGKSIAAEEKKAAEKKEFWQGVTKTAFSVLGNAAIGQIKRNYAGMQVYRNKVDSSIGELSLRVDKMPKDNERLSKSIVDLGKLYSDAAQKASWGFGKKRSEGRQDMARYMKQLTDMNAALETIKIDREKAQLMYNVLSGKAGENNQGGQTTMNAGANIYSANNSLELANGDMHQRLNWNIDTGQMEVQVGGEWKEDKATNKKVYMNKAETGTYEEYVASNQEMRSKLDKKYEKYVNEESGTGVSDANIQFREDWNKSQGFEAGWDATLSKEDWTKQNQENRGLVSTTLYSKLKFAEESDPATAEYLAGQYEGYGAEADKRDSRSWADITDDDKVQFKMAIDGFSDNQFRDFYFGGFSFNHSNRKMAESAPAYIRLKEEDRANGFLNDDDTFKKGYGPGSADWEGRLLSLKGQSFVSGSYFRNNTAEMVWDRMEDKYNKRRERYVENHPDIDPNNDPSKVYSVDGGQYGIPRADAIRLAKTMEGKGTSYAGTNVKYVQDGKGNTTKFLFLPKADNSGYIWAEQETMLTNDALQMRGLHGLGVNYETVETEEEVDPLNPEIEEIDPLQVKINKERLKKREEKLKDLEVKKNRYTPEEYEQKLKDIDNKYPKEAKK